MGVRASVDARWARTTNAERLLFRARPSLLTTLSPLLLASLRAYPDEDGPRERLAEVYDQQGDARGRFIRLQLERSRLEARQNDLDPAEVIRLLQIHAQEQDLRDRHEEYWLDEWGVEAGEIEWTRGLPTLTLSWERLWIAGEMALQRAPVIHLRIEGDTQRLEDLAEWPGLEGIVALDLQGHGLGPASAHLLTSSLYVGQLQRLEMGGNFLGDVGARFFAETTALPRLRMLGLASNNMGREGAYHLLRSNHFDHLSELDLGYNRIGVTTALRFPGVGLRALEILRLGGNRLGERGVELLEIFAALPSLRSLDLERNRLGAFEIERLFLRLQTSSLQFLGLAKNSISDRDIELLSACGGLTQLESLDLAENQLSDTGARSLLGSPYLTGVRVLRLAENALGDEGAIAVANSPRSAALRELSLAANGLGPAGFEAIARSPHLTSLRELDMHDNHAGPGGSAFLESRSMTLLRSFNLEDSHLSDEIKERLREHFGDVVLV